MLTIHIDDIQKKMESFVDDELKKPTSVFSKAKKNIDNFDNRNLDRLQKKVIDHIKKDFKKFLLQKPTQHQTFINQWKAKKSNLFYDTNIIGNDRTTEFGKNILKALNYKKLRNDLCVDISKIINIKTCPYCNAMLTINVGKIARYQLDHFYPKSLYPYLSISLFNLIPSCNNCNHLKLDKDVNLKENFHLYSDKPSMEVFKFSLDDADTIRYLSGINEEDLNVHFTFTDAQHKGLVEKHNKIFHIQHIYDTQNDIALDMIWRYQANNNVNIEELSKLLKISENEVKRMLVGNYIDYHDIHKRPLSKYMQDIAKDLKLL